MFFQKTSPVISPLSDVMYFLMLFTILHVPEFVNVFENTEYSD